jgi:hypothetical protein
VDRSGSRFIDYPICDDAALRQLFDQYSLHTASNDHDGVAVQGMPIAGRPPHISVRAASRMRLSSNFEQIEDRPDRFGAWSLAGFLIVPTPQSGRKTGAANGPRRLVLIDHEALIAS